MSEATQSQGYQFKPYDILQVTHNIAPGSGWHDYSSLTTDGDAVLAVRAVDRTFTPRGYSNSSFRIVSEDRGEVKYPRPPQLEGWSEIEADPAEPEVPNPGQQDQSQPPCPVFLVRYGVNDVMSVAFAASEGIQPFVVLRNYDWDADFPIQPWQHCIAERHDNFETAVTGAKRGAAGEVRSATYARGTRWLKDKLNSMTHDEIVAFRMTLGF